jgi:ADP-heptose:LPS heptosyltransferase
VRERLLVLRALGLGDLLTALPALRALAEAFPLHRRTLAAPAWLEPLALLSGAVDEVLPSEPLGPIDYEEPDVAVNLHGRGPESHRRLLETRPRRLIAFRNSEIDVTSGSPRWRDDEHEVSRWCRLLEESGIPADPAWLELDPPFIEPPDAARGATLLHPGASSGARRWPTPRWAAVARSERSRGRPVVVTAGQSEAEIAHALAEEAELPSANVFIGGDLLQLAALVAAASRVVSGDTGVAHLATALRKPSVVLFGPVSPALWGPPANGRHRVLWAGRTGDPHADAPDPGLLEISPEQVIAALRELDLDSRLNFPAA